MNVYLKRAKEISGEIVEHRRRIHTFAETGFELSKTQKYVMEKLTGYGYSPRVCGGAGITCLAGKDGPTILLRADMDALPMEEQTGLSYSSENGNCHACGHDCHTSMLLGAAKIIKGMEPQLRGRVKLMFQPAEEQLAGAKAMVKDGILENPKVDGAIALHIRVGADDSHSGAVFYETGTVKYSGDAIKISIVGKDAHGSTPYLGIDAIQIAAEIVLALNTIVTKNIPIEERALVLVGRISGGTAVNTVAGSAELEVSVRASRQETRDYLKNRVKEIAEKSAELHGGKAEVEFMYGMPPLVNDKTMTETFKKACEELLGRDKVLRMDNPSGSEDFCQIAQRVPSAYFELGAGSRQEGYIYSVHHPSMRINEDVLPIGAAIYAMGAVEILKALEKPLFR